MGDLERPDERPGERSDRPEVRIGDAERHAVAEILRQAAGEGRLTLEELDERLEAAYGARTAGELVPLTADLPAGHADAAATSGSREPVGAGERSDGGSPVASSRAVLSSQARQGVWEVGPNHRALAVFGSVTLDLREARLAAREIVIDATTVLGSVTIVVNARTRVLIEGTGVLGSFEQARDRVRPAVDPDVPLVRVRGVAVAGSVTVVRKRAPGERGWRVLGW